MDNSTDWENKDRYEFYLKEDDLWLAPYVGRKVNDHYEEYFDHNGYYPSDDEELYPEYSENSLILNLNPSVKDGIIESISYYKKVDNDVYSRHSTFKSITSKDIKIFKELLDKCTISNAGKILNELLDKPLPDGWVVAKTTEKTITIQKDSEKYNIPRDYAAFVVDAGRSIPDILHNRDFWHINYKKLRIKYMEGLMILLSNFNKENYPEIIIGETAMEIVDRENAISEAKASLSNAIRDGDKERVDDCLSVLNKIPSIAIDEAIKKWDPDLLLRLASKAAYSTDVYKIGIAAIELNDSKTLRALVEENGCQDKWVDACFKSKRLEDLLYLLDHLGELKIKEDCGYSLNALLSLVKYNKVAWTLPYLKSFYDLEDKTFIHTALKNLYIGKWGKGYSNSEIVEIVVWVMNCDDVELIDDVVSSGITVDYRNDLFVEAFERGGEFWEHIKPVFRNYTWRSFFSKFKGGGDYEFLAKFMDYYNIHATVEDVIDVIQVKRIDKRIAKLIIGRYDENIKPHNPVRIPLWEAFVRWTDADLFEYFINNHKQILDNTSVRDGIRHDILWYYPDIDKARFLVDEFSFTEDFVDWVSLSQKIRLTDVISETSKAISNFIGSYTYIEDDSGIEYIDDKTWEMRGSVTDEETGRQLEFHTRYYIADDDKPEFKVLYIRDKQ